MDGNNFIGLVGVDVELSRFNAIIKDIKPFDNSFAVLVSDGGIIISHPDESYINASINNSDLKASDMDIDEKIADKEAFTIESKLKDNKNT